MPRSRKSYCPRAHNHRESCAQHIPTTKENYLSQQIITTITAGLYKIEPCNLAMHGNANIGRLRSVSSTQRIFIRERRRRERKSHKYSRQASLSPAHTTVLHVDTLFCSLCAKIGLDEKRVQNHDLECV